ncbi:hypothetical protein PUN28_012853 [Cardiocondyla obscurior]|uniref:Uncharacterized protein n=1 Tax=Cardiocondyla obscurior TaxID=286306 RepID=A0AAW2F7N6_9HYME
MSEMINPSYSGRIIGNEARSLSASPGASISRSSILRCRFRGIGQLLSTHLLKRQSFGFSPGEYFRELPARLIIICRNAAAVLLCGFKVLRQCQRFLVYLLYNLSSMSIDATHVRPYEPDTVPRALIRIRNFTAS